MPLPGATRSGFSPCRLQDLSRNKRRRHFCVPGSAFHHDIRPIRRAPADPSQRQNPGQVRCFRQPLRRTALHSMLLQSKKAAPARAQLPGSSRSRRKYSKFSYDKSGVCPAHTGCLLSWRQRFRPHVRPAPCILPDGSLAQFRHTDRWSIFRFRTGSLPHGFHARCRHTAASVRRQSLQTLRFSRKDPDAARSRCPAPLPSHLSGKPVYLCRGRVDNSLYPVQGIRILFLLGYGKMGEEVCCILWKTAKSRPARRAPVHQQMIGKVFQKFFFHVRNLDKRAVIS